MASLLPAPRESGLAVSPSTWPGSMPPSNWWKPGYRQRKPQGSSVSADQPSTGKCADWVSSAPPDRRGWVENCSRSAVAQDGVVCGRTRNPALLQTWGTAARCEPGGGLGSIGERLFENNNGFVQGRGGNSECTLHTAHLPHDTQSTTHSG